MTFENMPYLSSSVVIGEIYAPQKDEKEPEVPKYIVRIQLPNGNSTLISNVISSTLFGGVYDLLQIQRRPTVDEDGQAPDPNSPSQFNKGDKVIVALPCNDFRRGIIIGGYKHPRSGYSLPNPDSADPQLRLSYQGLNFDINPDGEFILTHTGPQKVTNGIDVPIPDPTVLSRLSLLKDGSFKVQDANKQSITIDATNKQITLQSVKQELTMTADGKFKLSSVDTMELSAKSKYILTVGTESLTLDGVSSDTVLKGNKSITIDAGVSAILKGGSSVKLDGGKAVLELKNSKLSLGNGSIEVLDLLIKLLQEMQIGAPTFANSAVGPCVLNPTILTKITETIVKLQLLKL